jgi:dUTP pyrophosphatase
MQIRIRRLDATVPLPTYATAESAGFDLSASAEVTVAPRQIALSRPASSSRCRRVLSWYFRPKQHAAQAGLMVANGVGVIDPDYAGPNDEVRIQVLNVSTSDVHHQAGRPPGAGHRAAGAAGDMGRNHQPAAGDARWVRIHRH